MAWLRIGCATVKKDEGMRFDCRQVVLRFATVPAGFVDSGAVPAYICPGSGQTTRASHACAKGKPKASLQRSKKEEKT
jgi:hypothetical protein